MDSLTKELHTFLVRMGLEPDSVPHQTEHYMEHLLQLLSKEEAAALTQYYGLFGEERLSLHEIAAANGLDDENMMEKIDLCIRRLAVTPEWQVIKQNTRN